MKPLPHGLRTVLRPCLPLWTRWCLRAPSAHGAVLELIEQEKTLLAQTHAQLTEVRNRIAQDATQVEAQLATLEAEAQVERGEREKITQLVDADLCARFPIISPYGALRQRDSDKAVADRIVDGGYFDDGGSCRLAD